VGIFRRDTNYGSKLRQYIDGIIWIDPENRMRTINSKLLELVDMNHRYNEVKYLTRRLDRFHKVVVDELLDRLKELERGMEHITSDLIKLGLAAEIIEYELSRHIR
jgi:hypothetical protein